MNVEFHSISQETISENWRKLKEQKVGSLYPDKPSMIIDKVKLFKKLMVKKKNPVQQSLEFQMYLEICDAYLKKHKIKNPIVVELGIWKNRQKKFYEQILGAEHMGIDISTKRGTPDIRGNTHHSKTLKRLKKKLSGRSINILFIDAGHLYEDVWLDFEMYAPLCSDIIAFHDTEQCMKKTTCKVQLFWKQLKEKPFIEKEEFQDVLFISLEQYHNKKDSAGIGMIIKR